MKKAYRERLNRPLLSRMDRIHEWIQSGKYPNCVQMARDLGVAVRTVKRDVEYMRDTEHMPIGYDDQRSELAIAHQLAAARRVVLLHLNRAHRFR